MKAGIRVYIIANDEYYDKCEVYSKDDIDKHLEAYQAFSDEHHLGYHFKEEEYHDASVQIAIDGHFSVKIVEGISMIAFIPKVVTDHQLQWFEANKEQFQSYELVVGYAQIGDTVSDTEGISGLENIEKVMQERNENSKSRRVR